MIGTIRVWIIIAAIGAGCVGAVGVYGPRLARSTAPQFFVARAMLTLAQGVMPEIENLQAFSDLIEAFNNGVWRQELRLGINQLEGEITSNIDPSILSAAPMFTLKNVTRWDNVQEAFAAELALQMATTTIVNADLYLDRERMIVNIPMLFDFGLTVDPRRLGSDWDASLIGGMLLPGIIDDEAFYQMYMEMLFSPREEADLSGFIASMPELLRHMDFEYGGRHAIDDFEQRVDIFYLTIPKYQVNASIGYVISGVDFTDDITLVLHINGRHVLGIDYKTSIDVNHLQLAQSGHIRFTEELGQLQFELVSLESGMDSMHSIHGTLLFSDGPGHQAISFNINFTENRDLLSSRGPPQPSFIASLEGKIQIYPQDYRIEADFRNLSISWQSSDISLIAQYAIQVDNEPVIFDDTNSRALTDLNIFDLLGMYARIEGSPLGGMLGDFLLP